MGRSNLLLIFIFVLRGASCENIWCSTGGKNSKSICNCSEVTRKPWSNSSERPAPKPYNMSLEWFVSRQISETQIGINVSWTQKGADFDSDYCVKGYYLEISGLSRDAEKYLCKLQHFKTNEIFVGFHFVNWQPTGKVQQLTYEITALPLHIRGHKPSSSIDQTLIIPECCVNKADKHIDEHSNSVPLLGTVPTMNEHPLGSFPGVTAPAGHLMDPVKVITLVSLILSGFIIVALLVCISQKRRKGRHCDKTSNMTRRILIIIEDLDETSSKVANEFSKILRKYGGERMEISTNANKTVEIGEVGVVKWIAERVRDTDLVMVVVDPTREDIEETNLMLPSTVALKCFQGRSERVIIVNVRGGFSSHIVGTTYDLRRDFHEIVERVVGSRVRPVIQKELRNVERHLRNDETLVSMTMPYNNLNSSISRQERDLQSQSWNIIGDKLPSRESNL